MSRCNAPQPIGPERLELTIRGTVRVFGKGWLVGDNVTVPVDGRHRNGVVVYADSDCSEVRLYNWSFVDAIACAAAPSEAEKLSGEEPCPPTIR